MDEKCKALKADVNRKDALLKEYREKVNVLNSKIDIVAENDEELSKTKIIVSFAIKFYSKKIAEKIEKRLREKRQIV